MSNLNRSFNTHNRNRISRGVSSKSFNHHDKNSVRHHRGYYSEPLPQPSYNTSFNTSSYSPSYPYSSPSFSVNTSYSSPLSSGWCPQEEGVDKPTVMIHYMPHRTFETPIVCTCVRTLRGSMPDLSSVSNKTTSNREFIQSVRDVYALADALGKSCPTHPRDQKDEKTRKSDQVRKMLLKPLRALKKRITGKPTAVPDSFVIRPSKEPYTRFSVTVCDTLALWRVYGVCVLWRSSTIYVCIWWLIWIWLAFLQNWKSCSILCTLVVEKQVTKSWNWVVLSWSPKCS